MNQGIEGPYSNAVPAWEPTFENYILQHADGGAELLIVMDVLPEYRDFFGNTRPLCVINYTPSLRFQEVEQCGSWYW